MGVRSKGSKSNLEFPLHRLRPIEGRMPPSDLDAEGAVLSAILLSPDVLAEVSEFLDAEHFYADANRRVYEAIKDLDDVGSPIDCVTVASRLKDQDRLGQVGGTAYLSLLVNETPSIANVEAHAKIVRDKWRVRQAIKMLRNASDSGYGEVRDVQAFLDDVEQALFDIANTSQASTLRRLGILLSAVFDQITEAEQRGTGVTGVTTGIRRLDRLTAGLHPGELTVVAGRPGMGKTAFVLNVAMHVATSDSIGPGENKEATAGTAAAPVRESVLQETDEHKGVNHVLFFSLEMPEVQLAARLLASEARTNLAHMRGGGVTKSDWNNLTEACSALHSLPVWLDATSSISVSALRAKVRRFKAQIRSQKNDRIGLIVIDYLQLMEGGSRAQNREQQISEISRGLKALAKDFGVPVVALSQLNRDVEKRAVRRPMLSDLRESGAIEQDADNIVFVWRPEGSFDERTGDGVTELIVAKQRNGPLGTVKVAFSGASTRFDDLPEQDDEYADLEGPVTSTCRGGEREPGRAASRAGWGQ